MTKIHKGKIIGTEVEVKYVSWEVYAALEQNLLSMQETNRVLVERLRKLEE